MIKKTGLIAALLVVLSLSLAAAVKTYPLPDVQKSSYLIFDSARMYIVEGVHIYIYSLKDFKLIKKFGRQGEGPQEFKLHPSIQTVVLLDVSTNDILVNSFGKLSTFTKNGEFKKEMKLVNPFTFFITPLGNQYIAKSFDGQREIFQTLNVYDKDIKKIKEITRVKHFYQQGKGLTVLNAQPLQAVYKKRLYVAWKNQFEIRVFDVNLKELPTIKHKLDRIKVTDDDKKKIIHHLETSPETKKVFEVLKPINFPEYYPAMMNMLVTGDKINVITFNWKPKGDIQDFELLQFSLDGKSIGKQMVPVRMMSPLAPFPFNIHENKLYQLVENEDEEEWVLHVSDLK